MSVQASYMFLPDQASVATVGTTAGEMPTVTIAEGNHADVCVDLAAHIRLEAMRSEIAGPVRRLWQVADIVEASAWLPAGDYLWTVQLSPVMEVSYRVAEMRKPEDDLVQVA